MAKTYKPYAWAKVLSDEIMSAMVPYCHRVLVVGSVRRESKNCGDVEILARPKTDGDLFGADTGETKLDLAINGWIREGRMSPGRCRGQKHQSYKLPNHGDFQLDLFLVDAASWGIACAIRTGPATFSKSIVTPRDQGGLLDVGLKVHENKLWKGRVLDGKKVVHPGELIDTPEESDFLNHAGGWVEPNLRN